MTTPKSYHAKWLRIKANEDLLVRIYLARQQKSLNVTHIVTSLLDAYLTSIGYPPIDESKKNRSYS